MIGWILVGLGTAICATGLTTLVAAGAVSRIELYRWITGRAKGARAARVLLASPGRIQGAAAGAASAGALLVGVGVRAALDSTPPPLLVIAVLLVVIPVYLSFAYALPRAAGRRWAEPTIRGAVPLMSSLAAVLAPLLPQGSSVRPRSDLTSEPGDEGRRQAASADELSMVSGVLAFTERPVREVMTPRTEIVAVREGESVEGVARVFVESGYSRLPVYRDSLDHIIGMHYVFDLLKLAPEEALKVRPVAMTPVSRPCADLLFEMQHDRRQLAVVLDEFGGTAGIAAMDDLLQELVSETFEPGGGGVTVEPGGVEVVEMVGTAPAEDLVQRFGVTPPSGSATIGGLLARSAGRIPKAGERYVMAGLEFDVLAATPTHVERVAVRRAGVPVIRLGGGDPT